VSGVVEVGEPMNKNDHTFYFLRYPIGAGGAHLSNLISLDPSFAPKEPRMLKDEYIGYLINLYHSLEHTGHTAHTDANHTINDQQWPKYIEKLDYSFANSIHQGHSASFDWVAPILQTLKNKKYISLTINDQTSVDIVRAREKKIFNTDALAAEYYRAELQHYYGRWFISDNPEIVNDDINLLIEVSDLYYNFSMVLETINKKFNLNIPVNLANTFHNKWLDNIGYF